jgi:hypothetical protein
VKNNIAFAQLLAIFVLLTPFSSHATTNDTPLDIPHINQEIEIDGSLSEPSWENALKISLNFEVFPGENSQPPVATTAWLFEDGKNLYIGFDAKDSSIQNIKAYLSERDDIWSSDYVSIALDTFDDSRRAFQFYTNAVGVQADSIVDQITGKTDRGWDGIWQSASKINQDGYVVEMAIPLKSLRFRGGDSLKTWNIRLARIWPRDTKREFANVRDDRNNDCKICQYQSIAGFETITPAQNITLIPAVTLSKSETRDGLTEQNWQSGELTDRESLDFRWGIDQNVYLNATINPDFSQVEADELQLEVNKRFEVFTTEKRAFFLDGADYFSNWSRLVHTKLFAEPDYGVKLTGKSGAHSYGVISLKDKDTIFLLPDNQSSRFIRREGEESDNQIVRYRYDLGDKGNIGFTYTNRDSDDYSNEMLAIDGKYWFGLSDYIKFQVMTSDTLNPEEVYATRTGIDREQSGNTLSVSYLHTERDWDLLLTHHQFGKDFRADAGFVSRSDWKSSSVQTIKHWYAKDSSNWWNQVSAGIQIARIGDTSGNELIDRTNFDINFSGIYQSEFGVTYLAEEQNFVQQRVGDSADPALFGRKFDIKTLEVYFDFSPLAGLDISSSISWGDEIDFSTARVGDIVTIQPSVSYQLNDHWKITLDYVSETLEVDNETIYDVKLYNYRTAYQIDVNSFVRLTIQASEDSGNRTMASQLLYSYQVNPYSRFYFGYSDDGFKTADINHFKRTDRTLFTKFSYAWQL